MTDSSEQTPAERIAETYAPAPWGGALMAGASGALVAFGAGWGVLPYYDQRLATFWPVSAMGAVVAGAATIAIYARAGRRNLRAVAREQARLDLRQPTEPAS